ncbi:FecCD family ABC transporter permease [Candidatus Arthromitus sp. SFB-rat-Yit]|uniref:FecCD family ABC transporter permease n=1 Tax=Candidatus Arthromitus sp. SFB-rat-Yit TaxID=1041504 RepID=UPI000227A48B|nr:iron ABC transporter permease [Candidatus Arthromitus sp. SFB-rat-Yit]BAK81551.1 putative ferrichrome transport system permease protein FhuB [Candidatus Arthromitus sp. SFB-rat-Yit]
MKINKKLISIIGFVLLIIGVLASINIGAKYIPIKEVFNSIFFYDGSVEAHLIRDVRLPRVISALLNGGILAVCGAMIQGVMRNPLADPSVIGITQGATLAISLSTLFPIGLGIYGNFFMALIGSAFSGIIILIIMKNSSLNHNISKVLLASTAMSTLFISIASIIALIKNRSQELAFWISGSFNQNGWVQVISLIIIGSIFCFISFLMIDNLNVLNLGDENAISLGVSPSKMRIKIISIIIPLCSICVSTAGNISFVGLLVPHIIRKLVGTNYKDILPLSFLFGSVLLIFSDIIARTVLSPYELPVGIFTSFIGIPIFLLLIRKEKV